MNCAPKKQGFTLIEMLVAVFVMSTAIAFVTIVTGTVKVTRDSGFESIAFRVANTKLDDLRAGGYDALPVSGSFSDPALANLPLASASTSITDWNEKTKQVAVGVSWQGADGLDRNVSLATLITQSGGL